MKGIIAIILTLVLCFSMVACGKTAGNLKEAMTKGNVDYNDLLTDTEISYQNQTYRFNNKYDNFTLNLYNSLEEYTLEKNENYAETDNQYMISFWNFGTGYVSVFINDADQIRVLGDVGEPEHYISSGIYKKIQAELTPVIEKTSKYYSLKQDKNIQTSEYKIFDKKGNLMADNSADRNPHIYQLSDEVVAMWIQEGSLASTRSNTYFNWETGDISAEYKGYADEYGNYVCCGSNNKVDICDMFSGNVQYTFDKFSKDFSDMEDSIISVRFSNDGKQILVQYVDVNYEIVDEALDIPAGVMK